MIHKSDIQKAMGAGFIATLVMTIIMYLAPFLGMPKMDIAAMLGGFVTQSQALPWSGVWLLGMLIHFINGAVIFPMIFASWIYPALRGRVWLTGMSFGIALWFISQIAVMPLMGAGTFASLTAQPALMVIGSLIGHIIYGILLGSLYGSYTAVLPESEISRKEEEVTIENL